MCSTFPISYHSRRHVVKYKYKCLNLKNCLHCAHRSVEATRPTSPIRSESMYRPTPQRKPPPKPSGANIFKVSVSIMCLSDSFLYACRPTPCLHTTVKFLYMSVCALISVTGRLVSFVMMTFS